MLAREHELRTSMPFLYGLIHQLLLPAKSNREFLIAGSRRVDVWSNVPDEDVTQSKNKPSEEGEELEETLDEQEVRFNDQIGFEEPEDRSIAHNDRANQVSLLLYDRVKLVCCDMIS